MVTLFIKAGANCHAVDDSGDTPLDCIDRYFDTLLHTRGRVRLIESRLLVIKLIILSILSEDLAAEVSDGRGTLSVTWTDQLSSIGSAILSKMRSNFQKGQAINRARAATLNGVVDRELNKKLPLEFFEKIFRLLSLQDLESAAKAVSSSVFFKHDTPATNSDHVAQNVSFR